MGMNLEGFDANKVEVQSEYAALPAGEYQAIIVESEEKPTKAGNGKYLELRLNIQGPTHQGRILFDRLNLVNQNDTAQQIARATLSSICRAVNVLTPKDSSELHGKPLTVIVKTREYNGEIQNEIKGYKPRQLAGGGGHMIAEAFGGAQPAPAASGRPW